MQPIHCIPVERLPNPLPVVPPQQKQREPAVINSTGIDRHGGTCRSQRKKRPSPAAVLLKHFELRTPYCESVCSPMTPPKASVELSFQQFFTTTVAFNSASTRP